MDDEDEHWMSAGRPTPIHPRRDVNPSRRSEPVGRHSQAPSSSQAVFISIRSTEYTATQKSIPHTHVPRRASQQITALTRNEVHDSHQRSTPPQSHAHQPFSQHLSSSSQFSSRAHADLASYTSLTHPPLPSPDPQTPTARTQEYHPAKHCDPSTNFKITASSL